MPARLEMVTQPTSVLLVDDDPAILRLLAKWLESAGYNVLRASDARTAIELITAERPSILVAAAEMPQMDGIELCRWVRGQHLPTYLYTILLTVRGDSDEMLHCQGAGADDFVKKPVDRNELLARLRSGSRVTELERQLNQIANIDSLTGLATRRTLMSGLEREWKRAQRHNVPLSCAMLDIDFFKRINDTFGHAAGDEVLRRIGQLLLRESRSTDLAGRYGGEEFCIVLPETSEEQAAACSQRIRRAIAAESFAFGDKAIQVTASFGVAQRLADMNTPDQLVEQADQALLVAKRSGRDRVITCRSLSQTEVPGTESKDPTELLRGIAARTVMTSIVAPLHENDTVATAADYFLRLRIYTAPVVDDQGLLTGILAERDVMAVMLGKDWWTTRIKDAMKQNVVCYEEQTPALTIYEFLARVSIRSIVIVNRGRPTGLISRDSFLRFFINTLAVHRTGKVFPDIDEAERALRDLTAQLPPEDRIVQAIRQMAAEAEDLERRMAIEDSQDLVPCVVGGASRMQELVNDLLALSRFLDDQRRAPHGQRTAETVMPQGLAAVLSAQAGLPGGSPLAATGEN
jgi:diguanylate cyclase (GGDEF)-like protein